MVTYMLIIKIGVKCATSVISKGFKSVSSINEYSITDAIRATQSI